MPKLIWDAVRHEVVMEAQDADELSPEQAAAWGQIRTAAALDQIAERLSLISDELARVANGVN